MITRDPDNALSALLAAAQRSFPSHSYLLIQRGGKIMVCLDHKGICDNRDLTPDERAMLAALGRFLVEEYGGKEGE